MNGGFLGNNDSAQIQLEAEADYKRRRAEARAKMEDLLCGAPLNPRTAVEGRVPSEEDFVKNLVEWLNRNRIPEKLDEIRRAYGLPSPKPHRSKKV